jgi:hypothetical protein
LLCWLALPGQASPQQTETEAQRQLIPLTCETLDSTTRPSFPILIGIMEAELAAGQAGGRNKGGAEWTVGSEIRCACLASPHETAGREV